MKTKPSTTMEGFSIETHPYQNSSNQWAAAVQMISFKKKRCQYLQKYSVL